MNKFVKEIEYGRRITFLTHKSIEERLDEAIKNGIATKMSPLLNALLDIALTKVEKGYKQ